MMLVLWSWRSFFRSFFLTGVIAGMALFCGMGVQKAFARTEQIGYGAMNSDYVRFFSGETKENLQIF